MNGNNLDEILKANPNAPTNDQYAKDLASRLFVPVAQRVEADLELEFFEGAFTMAAREADDIEWCGESTVGLVEAVLASNLISTTAKDEIETMMADSMPSLEKEKTVGHFHFRWTETSPDSRDNTNETNIDATAVFLNECWDLYTTNFRQPKAALIGGQRIIDIEVYYNPGLHGSTSSQSNRIYLNSHTVVNDACRRRTTSAHELFHRVEYAYGYVTGTAGQRWWVEAMASWSQDFTYDDVNDYVSRVNGGLGTTDSGLLNRSYDACHYWKYLGEQLRKRAATIPSDERALREVLNRYSTNGLDAKAASGTVTQDRLGRSFDRFFQDWSKANYIKDLENPTIKYEYDEDEEVTNSCGRTYGPYAHVLPIADVNVSSDTFTWNSGLRSVNSYGTDYLILRLDPSVSQFSLRFEGNPSGGSGQFSAHLIMIKDNRWSKIYNSPSTTEKTWSLSFSAGTYDTCVLVINGLGTGGDYEVSLNACISGVWRDGFNYVWTLIQSGDDITGTVQTTSCGTYTVTGTFTGTDITLNATGSCCDFTYEGTIDDCENGSGNWTSDCGGSGSWTMTKTDADEAMAMFEAEEEEFADEPTTMQP
jgi:hypothetical protein